MWQNASIIWGSVATLTVWIAVLTIHLIYKKLSSKVHNAKSLKDIGLSSCSSIEGNISFTKMTNNMFLIMSAFISIVFVLSVFSRLFILSREGGGVEMNAYYVLSKLINPSVMFVWLCALGAWTITRIIYKYYIALYGKCQQLEALR